MARIRARYFIETPYPLRAAAETLAGEQSSGTFVRVPGETHELRERHAARIEDLIETGEAERPSLPVPDSVKPGIKYKQAELFVSWPLENMGTSLPNVWATVAGNLFELKQFWVYDCWM